MPRVCSGPGLEGPGWSQSQQLARLRAHLPRDSSPLSLRPPLPALPNLGADLRCGLSRGLACGSGWDPAAQSYAAKERGTAESRTRGGLSWAAWQPEPWARVWLPGSWSGHGAADLPPACAWPRPRLTSAGWTVDGAASPENAAHCEPSPRIPSRPHPEVKVEAVGPPRPRGQPGRCWGKAPPTNQDGLSGSRNDDQHYLIFPPHTETL